MLLDVVPRWVQAIVAVLALVGIGAGGTVVVTKVTSGTSTARPSQTPRPRPTGPVYLSDLQVQGGDTPTRGDTQIGEQDFPHSIFYDNIPGNQSNTSACQNSGDPTCQASDYSIATARYHEFSAMLGVVGCSGDTAHWSLTVDSIVVKSGTVAVNNSPQPIAVAIPRGNSLQLLAGTSTSFSGAACGSVDIIWGNAQLS